MVPSAMAAQERESDVLALDSLLNTPIDASGKYQQTAREAASSVTIVTHEQIEHFGYRTLNDVLQGVSGFYLSNDRNPTDYNNRILLMIDGHQMNAGIWGSAPLELPIDPEYLERVEIVRGPGSALYGTGAIFGVINLVTRSGASISGSQAAVLGGSYGQRSVSAVQLAQQGDSDWPYESNFAHTRSFELALRLEEFGCSESVEGAAEVCAELHRAIEELVSLLGEFTEPVALPE